MKNGRIDLRASTEDEKNIQLAAKKLKEETGSEPNVSKVLLHSVAEYANQEPELFFVNRPAIRDVDRNIEQGLKMLQAIIDLAIKASVSISLDVVQSWYGTGRKSLMVENQEAIRETIISKLFEVQRDKYPGLQFTMENIQVPDLTELMEAASKLIFVPDVANREVGIYWNCYQIEEGKISVIPEQVEQIKNQFRAYVISPDERRKLLKARNLCETLNKFIEGESIAPSKISVPGVCYFDSESNRFEPSEQFVKFGLNPKFIFTSKT